MNLLTPENVKLGFIGLGNMGSRIVLRLVSHGYSVSVFDLEEKRVAALKLEGALASSSIAELARAADVVLSCLTNDEAVQNAYYGNAGVLASATPGTLVFEMSTVSPQTSRELNKHAAEYQVGVLDVAISGSTPAAEQGSLILLAGGNAEGFEAAQPLFAAISAHSFHMGAAGCGTTMKLVVNTLLGVGMQAIAEAVTLGEKAGIQRNRLLDVLSQTAVVAPAHAGKLARAAHQDYSPQFPLRLMNKDFGLILKQAELLNVMMPATLAAFGVNSMELKNNPDTDFSAVIRRMEELAEVTDSDGRLQKTSAQFSDASNRVA